MTSQIEHGNDGMSTVDVLWVVVTSQIEHGDDVMSTVDVLWVVTLAFPDGGGVWLQCVC